MPNYLRARDPGGTFFFTLVTERRQPILTTDLGRQLLSDAIRVTLAERPVIVQAMVLLPDHLHAIWTLPEDETDYSMRWSLIKRRFARELLPGAALCVLATCGTLDRGPHVRRTESAAPGVH